MQNRSALWIFTILLALACLYSLSFSLFTSGFESEARDTATFQTDSMLVTMGYESPSDAPRAKSDSLFLRFENKFIRANGEREIFPILGFTYNECKAKELNLGLDLKGGMAVTMEVSIPELIVNLADGSKDTEFRTAIANARTAQLSSDDPFVDLFLEEYNKVSDKPQGLAAIFSSQERTQFPREGTNEDIADVLSAEVETAVDNTERILRTRIDKFGVSQPSIQKQLGGRIVIELPGVKDKDRVRKILQGTANLEFWECYDNQEFYSRLEDLDTKLSDALYPGFREALERSLDTTIQNPADTASLDTSAIDADVPVDVDGAEQALLGDENVEGDSAAQTGDDLVEGGAPDDITPEQIRKRNPLFSALNPAFIGGANGGFSLAQGSVVGYAQLGDTADVNRLLFGNAEKAIYSKAAANAFPKDSKLLWGAKTVQLREGGPPQLPLYAIKVPRSGKAKIDGSVITDASQDFGINGGVEVVMQMNAEGAQEWKRMTGDNIKKQIAVVLDNLVYSAPTVQAEIAGGRSSITLGSGDNLEDQLVEAGDLANILKAGALPAPARIIDETVVGPTLGEKNINSGFRSFLIALVLVLIYMVLYYAGAGLIADIALVANLVFLIGALASMQAALTLPGIAGIVLTIGMAVDANVLIFDRIREEMRAGKMVKSAVEFGYSIKGALSAILDANITTGITAVILLFFGSGPVRGFATTLLIGIFTSLFAAIFITRLLLYIRLEKKKDISFWTKPTKNILANPTYDFMSKRKLFYGISFIVIGFGIASMATKGFTTGVDFDGGRSYVVRFDEPVDIESIKTGLNAQLVDEQGKVASTEVKTYGVSSQVKISTNYLVEQLNKDADLVVEEKLATGLNSVGTPYVIEESRKVDATISDDIKLKAIYAISLALIFIFIYIAVRFRKWQFGLGAILALVHDVLIVLGLYSILDGLVSWSLEINGDFIAALLTVVGYSINDTVVVFDRIREFLGERKRETQKDVVNSAMNATLSRTVNTSLTTFLVLLVIFLLGGVSLQGFVFALLIGVVVGTYSSLFIATNSVVDLVKDMDQSQR